MHSTLVRAQNVFGFFTTVAFTTAILTALSVLLIPQSPKASIELRNVQVYAKSTPEHARIPSDHQFLTDTSTESKAALITTLRKRKNMPLSDLISTLVSFPPVSSRRVVKSHGHVLILTILRFYLSVQLEY